MQQNLNSNPTSQMPLATEQMPGQEKTLAGAWPLIKQSWAFYKKYWPQFIKLLLFPLIPVIGLLIVLGLYAGAQAAGLANPVVNIVLAVLGLASIAAIIVVSLFVYPAMYLVVKREQAGDPSARLGVKRAGKFLGEAKSYVWSFLWVSFLSGILILGASIFLIIPGILVGVWFSLCVVIIFFENQRGYEALRRSKELVKGYWWKIFWRWLALGLFILVLYLPNIASSLLDLIYGKQAPSWLGILFLIVGIYSFVLDFIIGPLCIIYEVKLFQEMKRIKGESKLAPADKGAKAGVMIAAAVLILAIIILLGFSVWGFVANQNKTYNLREATGDFRDFPVEEIDQESDDAPSGLEDFFKQIESDLPVGADSAI